MKVDNERRAAAASQPRTEFKKTLKQVTPPPLPKAKLATSPIALGHPMAFADGRAHAHKVADVLKAARVGMEAKVEKAHEVRIDGVAANENQVESKVLDLIARELKDDAQPSKVAEVKCVPAIQIDRAANPTPAGAQKSETPKVSGIMELVERVRVFEKAGRPAMALSVGGSLNAEVEIERAGPKLVALKVIGKGRIPSAANLNEIRDELAKCGIKVSALSICSR
jgi:hypothetical protein